MKYWLVSAHNAHDYFVSDDDGLLDAVEDICPICGDHDSFKGYFTNLSEAKKLISNQDYSPEYVDRMIEKATNLVNEK